MCVPLYVFISQVTHRDLLSRGEQCPRLGHIHASHDLHHILDPNSGSGHREGGRQGEASRLTHLHDSRDDIFQALGHLISLEPRKDLQRGAGDSGRGERILDSLEGAG